jgi:membrane protease YdiL (CAAX protease family)
MVGCFSKHPFLFYVVLTYSISWALLIPFVYLWRGPLDRRFEWWLIFFLPGGYGPTIAALFQTRFFQGRKGVRHLLGSLFLWRAPWRWYLVAIIIPFASLILAVCLSSFRHAAWAGFARQELVLSIPVALLVALPFGPLAEELGWRGFALPMLQRRFSPLGSSLILAVVWTFWHTPLFWFPGAAIPSFLDLTWYSILLYGAQLAAISVLLTSVFNNTGGSVLLAILLHLTFNSARNGLLPAFPEPTEAQKLEIFVINILVLWVFALLITVAGARKSGEQLQAA